MVPLNIFSYLYYIVKNILSIIKPKPKKTPDKRQELKKVRKQLKAWYDKKEKENNNVHKSKVV